MLGFGNQGGVCIRQGGGLGGGNGGGGGGGGQEGSSSRTCDRDGERPLLVLAGDYIASTHVVLRGAFSLVQVRRTSPISPMKEPYITHKKAPD